MLHCILDGEKTEIYFSPPENSSTFTRCGANQKAESCSQKVALQDFFLSCRGFQPPRCEASRQVTNRRREASLRPSDPTTGGSFPLLGWAATVHALLLGEFGLTLQIFWGRHLRKCYRAETEAAILHQEGLQLLRSGASASGLTVGTRQRRRHFEFCRLLLPLQVARMKVLAAPPKQRSNSSVVCGLELRRSFANSPWTQQHARPFKVIIRPVLLDRITHWVAQLLPFGILFNKFSRRGGGGGLGGKEGGGELNIKKTSVTPAVLNQFSHRRPSAHLDLQMFTCESS